MTSPDPSVTIKALREMLVVKEREANTLLDRIAGLERDLAQATENAHRASAYRDPVSMGGGGGTDPGIVETDDRLVLQEVGIYTYHHPLENAAAYRDQLTDIQAAIKDAVTSGEAIAASNMFSFNNSLAKGRKMTADLSKLMLRAYNAEADICVRTIRAGNLPDGPGPRTRQRLSAVPLRHPRPVLLRRRHHTRNALHNAFTEQRLNHANLRREFFFATPAQVREVLAAHVGNLLEYTEQPDATQYFQSRSNWPAGAATGPTT